MDLLLILSPMLMGMIGIVAYHYYRLWDSAERENVTLRYELSKYELIQQYELFDNPGLTDD